MYHKVYASQTRSARKPYIESKHYSVFVRRLAAIAVNNINNNITLAISGSTSHYTDSPKLVPRPEHRFLYILSIFKLHDRVQRAGIMYLVRQLKLPGNKSTPHIHDIRVFGDLLFV